MEFLIAWIVCIVIGGLIGKHRGRVDSGVFWSAILGPIGWLMVALMEDLRPKCPLCRGVVAEGASRCMHCGGGLVVASGLTRSDWDKITADWDAPKTGASVAQPLASQKPAPDSTIPCPLCGRSIMISTLKQGENHCPHCYEKFIAE